MLVKMGVVTNMKDLKIYLTMKLNSKRIRKQEYKSLKNSTDKEKRK